MPAKVPVLLLSPRSLSALMGVSHLPRTHSPAPTHSAAWRLLRPRCCRRGSLLTCLPPTPRRRVMSLWLPPPPIAPPHRDDSSEFSPLMRVEGAALSYPTSAEYLGRGIDLIHNSQMYSFTFDKVFDQDVSQEEYSSYEIWCCPAYDGFIN